MMSLRPTAHLFGCDNAMMWTPPPPPPPRMCTTRDTWTPEHGLVMDSIWRSHLTLPIPPCTQKMQRSTIAAGLSQVKTELISRNAASPARTAPHRHRQRNVMSRFSRAMNHRPTWEGEEGFSCERGSTRDDCGKAGPFSVERLKMDLPL